MEKVSTNITTNQSAITTTQPPSAVCNTCTDSIILNGVLGGILFVALIPVAICFCKKRISEFIFKTNYLYEALLVILPIVSSGLSLPTGITLIINCVKINPIQCPVGYGWIGMVCFVFLDLVASIGITVYLKHRKSIYDKKNQREQEVQDLRTFIESAYELCETAKEELNFIKETVFIDQAEKKEQQLQKSVMEWNTTITKADQLEKKLRKARKKDSVPLISDPLETEIQRTRPKNENQRIINYIKYLKDARDKDVQHDNNIGGFTHEAEQEIKFKKEVQDLRTFIESAYELCERAKEELNFIKETVFIDQAEKTELQLQKSVMDWNTTITDADQLEKKLRSARKRDNVPLISDQLETEIQRNRPKLKINYIQYLKEATDRKVQHDNNIDGFTHEAEQEIKFKKEVQELRKLIEKAQILDEDATKKFNIVKETLLIDTAETTENELKRIVTDWNTTFTKADELEKELLKVRKKDGVPLTSDALEKEIQRTRPENEKQLNKNYIPYLKHAMDNKIDGLLHKAEQEIKFKKEEISPNKLKAWREDEKTFFATKSTELIYKAVKHKGYLICGLPGAGKTANVHHIALRLKGDGYKLCCVGGIKDLIDKTGKFETEQKQVYVIDDVFGVHGVNDETVKEWTEKHKDDIKRCLDKPNIILLCSSRVQVVNDHKLSNIIKSYFTVINISEEEAKLPSEARSKERVEIFRKHASVKERVDLLKDEVHLKEEIENKIQKIECPAGCFPLICRLYVGDKETNQTIENYFNKPLLEQIHEHIQSLQNSPSEDVKLGYFCLLMCMIYDSKVPVNTMEVGKEEQETKHKRQELLELCELSESTSRPTIKKKMDTLLQTFVKREGSHYHFVHDIIHDAVIKHVNGLSSSVHKVIMRHCSSKFMRDRVHLSGVVCKDMLGHGHDTESCINIRRDSFTCWGERVLDIVRDGVCMSDQLYNDIDEGRCSIHDDRVWLDNPWCDVFKYNRCVHSTEGQTAIVQALKSSDVQTIMCTKGYRLYGDHRVTGLHWAMKWGLTHIVTQTVSMLSPTQLREVDSIDDGGLLCSAIRGRCGTDVIQALIVGGVNVNTPDVRGDTPLCSAIDGRCGADVIQALIVGGVDVNTPGKWGNTPLCMAIYKRCGTDVIQALIVGGADVNTPDVRGRTPLHWSVSRGDYKITQLLVDKGADVSQCDERGRSVLYWSQLGGYDTITELLQSRGAVCIYEGNQYNHVTDIPDLTLLDFVWSNNYQAVKILIERGADVNQCYRGGKSVLYTSQLYGCDTITELLQSRGAVCIYKGKRYTTITDIPDSEVNSGFERRKIQELKEKQNVTKC